MWLYLIIFFIPVCWYFIGKKSYSNKTSLFVYMTGLALFVGMADMLGGYDRYIYGEVFDNIANVTNLKQNYYSTGCFEYFASEPGYTFLNIFISFITENRYVFIFIITLLIYSFLFISIKRYAINFPFAIILFQGLWFYFTFTYLRQVLGATLVWLSLPYIINRKFWKFALLCIVAITIHKSAIVFFPVYFITNKRLSNRVIILCMISALILGLSPFPNLLFNAYGDVSATEMQQDYSAAGNFRFEYFMEAAFFLYFILKYIDSIPQTKEYNVMLNIALLFCITLLVFIRSENGGRLSWYYLIGIIITITHITTRQKVNKLIPASLIIVSLLLNIRIFVSWQNMMELYPYKTFMSNGQRKGDPILEKYEYDYLYEENKLYRKPFRIRTNTLIND